VWRQITADVLGLPVVSLAGDPGAALAAAFVAGMGPAFSGHGTRLIGLWR